MKFVSRHITEGIPLGKAAFITGVTYYMGIEYPPFQLSKVPCKENTTGKMSVVTKKLL
jgi:hypothetical protein